MSTLEKKSEANFADEMINDDRYLTFHLDRELYGVNISSVMEIIGIQEFTKIPDLPRYIKGVINLRGQVIPVIDLRLRFKIEEMPYTDRTCIIIINHNDMEIGIVIDEVSEVIQIDPENIDAAPKTTKKSKGIFLSGMARADSRVIMLINADKVFDKTI